MGRPRGFTLLELLAVIGIVAILAAIIFPVLAQARRQPLGTSCISNLKQVGTATELYLSDSDGIFPQTRQHSAQPDVDDVSGAIDEPVYETWTVPLQSYLGSGGGSSVHTQSPLLKCSLDEDPFGQRCAEIDPDAPAVTSYLLNGYFVFGLGETSISNPATTVQLTERRSSSAGDVDPYCDDIYHPWFNASNPKAPENEMDAMIGAIATGRHQGLANYGFEDGHVKSLHWAVTYSPPSVNQHFIRQP